MTENNTDIAQTDTEQTAAASELDPNAGIASAAAAESAEVLNLLNDEGSKGGCCGGACCS